MLLFLLLFLLLLLLLHHLLLLLLQIASCTGPQHIPVVAGLLIPGWFSPHFQAICPHDPFLYLIAGQTRRKGEQQFTEGTRAEILPVGAPDNPKLGPGALNSNSHAFLGPPTSSFLSLWESDSSASPELFSHLPRQAEFVLFG